MSAVIARTYDEAAGAWLHAHGYRYVIQDGWSLPEERVLFVADGVAIPFQMLEAGFGLLDAWEAAAPLWRYGILAQDIGTGSERERTKRVTLDLRVLPYACELLFVRAGGGGERLLQVWREECEGGGDERLAFLRALHIVKPILCTLPADWLHGAALPLRQSVRAPAPGSLVWVHKPRVSRRQKEPAIRAPVRRR